MKRLLIASALMFAVSGVASADNRGKGHHEAEKDRREAVREAEKDRREAVREHGKDRREAYRERTKAARQWARGQYIPREYLVDRYTIRDYRRYELAPPPAGYVYVRPYPQDDRYYLVQAATGLISRILGY